jgi:type I restriction enzyme S subunit
MTDRHHRNAQVDSQWLHWLTKTKPFWDQCDEKSRGTSGKNRIRPEQFLSVSVPLPPIEEQRRIVERINEIGQKIGRLTTLRAEAAKETESSHRSAVEEVFLELSKRYGLSTVDRVCHSVTDGDHQTPRFSDEGIKFIFVGNASSGLLHFTGCKHVTPDYFSNLKPQRVPKRGDMLYTAVGATLGVAAVVDTDEPFCFQRHVAILKLDQSQIDSRFMWHMLRSQTVFRKAWDATTGSAQPTVPLRAIKQLPIPVPPLNEQRTVVDRLDELTGRMDRLTKHQDSTQMEIEALLASVLHKAFHGELR